MERSGFIRGEVGGVDWLKDDEKVIGEGLNGFNGRLVGIYEGEMEVGMLEGDMVYEERRILDMEDFDRGRIGIDKNERVRVG